MSALKKLEQDFARANRSAVASLLARATDEDILTRLGLESRLLEIDEQIAAYDQVPPEAHASAALFFGGRPVVGTIGVEAEFGSEAVAAFQDLVAKVAAKNGEGLGTKGPVANKAASSLHITNIVRGSFGFLLEEVRDQAQILGTPLREAVEDVSELLSVFGDADEEKFRAVMVEADQRILATAEAFFKLMSRNGATLRMVTDAHEFQFGADAIERAVQRADTTKIEEKDPILHGRLGGALPGSHQIEFRLGGANGELQKGKVSAEYPAAELERWNRELVGLDALLSFHVKRVLRNGDVVRESYLLRKIDLIQPQPIADA